jgi:hypothetical protein
LFVYCLYTEIILLKLPKICKNHASGEAKGSHLCFTASGIDGCFSGPFVMSTQRVARYDTVDDEVMQTVLIQLVL